jgi:DNA-binding winged helix-turn-helix (wHTH) protein
MMNGNHNIFEFDDVRVEPSKFKIWKAGEEVAVEPKTFQVLLFLLENRGRLIEKNELLEAIWRDTFVTENAMTREIAKLRKALGDDPKTPKYIQTVHTQGYRFIAETEERREGEAKESKETETKNDLAPAPSDAPISNDAFAGTESSDQIKENSTSRHLSLKPLTALGVIAAVLAIGFFVWKWQQEKTEAVKFLKTSQITSWTGLDIHPAFSPDGNSIAYSSDHNGNFEIYVKPMAPGANEIQLTSDGEQNFQPAFSPDGKFIAFYSKNRGGIWVIPASGGKARQMTAFGSRPAWSPDGNSIAFQSDPLTDLGANASPALPPSTVWIVPMRGGEPVQLTQAGNPSGGHGSPSWSPDGERIVFSASEFAGNSGLIWTVSSKGGDLKQIAKQGSEPVFAPDGKRVFYGSRAGLQTIRVSPSSGDPIGETRSANRQRTGANSTFRRFSRRKEDCLRFIVNNEQHLVGSCFYRLK